ncbi:MAG TPA: SEC-C metal-binding domain-containing protein, partial [Acidimicrobiales bacterium]|jgi:preprotein translocase subunit SecA
MNEQRKVIYLRRQQVIDGEDIHDWTIALLEQRLEEIVRGHLGESYVEEWDVNALLVDLQTYYPTTLSADAVVALQDVDDVVAAVVDEALTLYAKKCDNFPGGLDTAREIERDVMLQILDQRWREHLSDMDYLRDGIHLRQVAQQDPLTAWQKEGYVMFEHLLDAVDLDYVRYITHVEAVAPEATLDDGLRGAVTNANEVAPGGTELPVHATPAKPAARERDKIGRNDPCWCGSGRKFKQCHGRP